MTSFFGVGVNPFSTQVGQRIEQATDGSLASENWALNMEICDLVNETEDGPKDAIKAIKKRLQQNAGKNYTVVMFTLTVLETCVKNCNKRFHILVCNKEFINELVKLIEPTSCAKSNTSSVDPGTVNTTSSWFDTIPNSLQSLTNTITAHLSIDKGPKNDPPTIVQEKVLSLIQTWADAFRNQPELMGVVQVYHELKNKGIEFPPTDLDAMAPIFTPQRSVPTSVEIPVGVQALVAQQEGSLAAAPTESENSSSSASAAAPYLTTDQITKLRYEMNIVQGNMAVLNEMMSELVPGKEHPSDIQLLKDVYSACVQMQQRLVQLINKLANDEMTADLLRINDLMNNLILRYKRYEKNRDMTLKEQSNSAKEDKSLIDLNDKDDSLLDSQLSALALGGASASSQLASISSVSAQNGIGLSEADSASNKDDSEFDMFAQSRNVTYESSKKGGSSYEANLEPDQVSGGLSAIAHGRTTSQTAGNLPSVPTMHNESDFDEMAAWLGEEESAPLESLTSNEFERFLAERAAAAENIQSSSPQASTGGTPKQRNRKPHKEKEESLIAM